ncbi:protein tyrosine phosphatase [Ochrobactrum sp. MYb29]|nr:dual specificity protein phosphatase family protein [Brucella pituitosa]PJO48257.1 protein tyrosine phosphatase [Brucella pituitosa]PRA80527.1 protein tyrosine phosphatase [Ochrobactrum sp. MYb29]
MLILLGIFASYLIAIQLTGNFHVVVEGELYRSNQPDIDRLVAMKKDYGIKTIINLRGESPGSKWFEQEVYTANALKMDFIDFEMSATRQLNISDINRLVEVMSAADKPILIHCKSGADRTGLAAALYVAAIVGKSSNVAQQQLSILYGHFGFPLSSTYAMDRSFETYLKHSMDTSDSSLQN